MTRTVPVPPAGLELSLVPNIRQTAGAAEWIRENLGIEVSENYIRVKTVEKKITYSKIQGIRYYSSQALYDFIMSTVKVSA